MSRDELSAVATNTRVTFARRNDLITVRASISIWAHANIVLAVRYGLACAARCTLILGTWAYVHVTVGSGIRSRAFAYK